MAQVENADSSPVPFMHDPGSRGRPPSKLSIAPCLHFILEQGPAPQVLRHRWAIKPQYIDQFRIVLYTARCLPQQFRTTAQLCAAQLFAAMFILLINHKLAADMTCAIIREGCTVPQHPSIRFQLNSSKAESTASLTYYVSRPVGTRVHMQRSGTPLHAHLAENRPKGLEKIPNLLKWWKTVCRLQPATHYEQWDFCTEIFFLQVQEMKSG